MSIALYLCILFPKFMYVFLTHALASHSFPTLASISRYFLFHSQSHQFLGSFIILTHLISEPEQDDVPCTYFLNILLDHYIRKFTKFQIHNIQFTECYLTFTVRCISYPTSRLFQIFFLCLMFSSK